MRHRVRGVRPARVIFPLIFSWVLAGASAFAGEGDAPGSPEVRYQSIFMRRLSPRRREQNEYRQQLLRGILRRVVEGDSFERLARAHSDYPESVDRRGRPVTAGFFALPLPLQDAIRSMAPGQVSPIIETATGIQIIRVLSIPEWEAMIPPPTPTVTPTPDPGPIPPKAGTVASATFPLHVRFGEISWDERTDFVQLSPLTMIPADPEMPFVRKPNYLYALVSPATFYVPVEPPLGSEIIGFALWHHDVDPNSSIVASLWATLKDPWSLVREEIIPPRLIGRVNSDMPGMPHIHQPGGSLSERVYSGRWQYYMEIVLNSGDDRQMVFGGHVAYAFEGPGGVPGAQRHAWTIAHEGVPAKMPVWARAKYFPNGTPTPTNTPTPTPTPPR